MREGGLGEIRQIACCMLILSRIKVKHWMQTSEAIGHTIKLDPVACGN